MLERPEGLPERSADWLRQFGRAVVLAPHPDDESLGVGGVIASLVDLGLPVGVVFLTDGGASHHGSASHPPDELEELRRSEARAACRALGVKDDAVAFLGLPDGGRPAGPAARGFGEAADRLRDALESVVGEAPHTVLTPWRREPHGGPPGRP